MWFVLEMQWFGEGVDQEMVLFINGLIWRFIGLVMNWFGLGMMWFGNAVILKGCYVEGVVWRCFGLKMLRLRVGWFVDTVWFGVGLI